MLNWLFTWLELIWGLIFGERKQRKSRRVINLLVDDHDGNDDSGSNERGEVSGQWRGEGEKALIMFGSETGTARGFAKRLGRILLGSGWRVKVVKADESGFESGEIHGGGGDLLLLGVFAVTGDGEATGDSENFVRWMNDTESRKGEDWSGVSYSVFACGDSMYEKFCEVGKAVDGGLKRAGATRVHALGLGDDSKNLERDWEEWIRSLSKSLGFIVDQKGVVEYHHEAVDRGHGLVVVDRQMLFEESDRGAMRVGFEASNGDWEAGDHLIVFPENRVEDVDELVNALEQTRGCQENQFDRVKLRQALLTGVDYRCAKVAQFWKDLRPWVTQEAERASLDARMADRSLGRVVDVVKAVPSCSAQWEVVLGMMPRMKPRYYSVSSHSGVLEVTVGIQWWEEDGRRRAGVATEALMRDDVVWAKIKHNWGFRCDWSLPGPVMLIGPGTGMGALRGFVQGLPESREGRLVVVNGSRSETSELYCDELKELAQAGRLEYHAVHSPVYVQEFLSKNSELLELCQEDDARIFVCGGRAMGQAVLEVLGGRRSGIRIDCW